MIIDSHFHLGRSSDFYFYNVSIEEYINQMERYGIAFCINASLIGLLCGSMKTGLHEGEKAYDVSRGKILSYYVFDPNRPKESIASMETYDNTDIFKGIKIHPSFHKVYADDSAYKEVWEFAMEKGIPIMSHTWENSPTNASQKYSYPPLFEKYVSEYPEVKFICGHAGGRYDGIKKAVELVNKYSNVYVDIAGDVYYKGFIEYLTKNAGADRILFGSDSFWIDWRTQLGMVLGADITLADKAAILGRTALNVFKLEV